MEARDTARYLLLGALAAVAGAVIGEIKPIPLAVAAALFLLHGLLGVATAGRERFLPRDLLTAALLLGCLVVSGSFILTALALRLAPPVTADGHRVMPIGQTFTGVVAGTCVGVGAAMFGSLRNSRRNRRCERLIVHTVGVLLIVVALIERRWR